MTVHTFDLAEGRTLEVNVTDEGIVMDLFKDGKPIGTFGKTADELAEQLMDEERQRWA